MTIAEVDLLYDREIRGLSLVERLRLAQRILGDATADAQCQAEPKRRSLLELEGLGAEIWEGVDAQEYVNELRAEWDHRP